MEIIIQLWSKLVLINGESNNIDSNEILANTGYE